MTAENRNPDRSTVVAHAPGERLNFWLCALLLGGCLVFGGGGGWFGDSLLQVFSLLVLLISASRLLMKPEMLDVPLLLVLGGILLLAVIQLVPLPPAIWQQLGGRAELVQQMAALGIHPGWHPLTLSPTATERSLLSVLPGVAICLSVMTMATGSRTRLVVLLCLFAVLSLMLQLAQIASGEGSVLRFYGTAQGTSAGGFYANSNHFACMLAMVIPLSVALLVSTLRARSVGRRTSLAKPAILSLMIGALLIGVPDTGSRAGLALGALAVAGSLGLLLRAGLGRRIVYSLIGVGVLGLLLVTAYGLDPVLSRMNQDAATDARWAMHATTLEAARHFGPLGSGLGTFVSAYQAVEHERDMLPEYVNYAHSDYHELLLEAGWPGMALIGIFLGWYLWRSTTTWMRSTASPDALNLARAASIAIFVVLVHSWVDYPLRNTATLALFGMCCALICRGNRITRQASLTTANQSTTPR
jgi:O-antigen ligase